MLPDPRIWDNSCKENNYYSTKDLKKRAYDLISICWNVKVLI